MTLTSSHRELSHDHHDVMSNAKILIESEILFQCLLRSWTFILRMWWLRLSLQKHNSGCYLKQYIMWDNLIDFLDFYTDTQSCYSDNMSHTSFNHPGTYPILPKRCFTWLYYLYYQAIYLSEVQQSLRNFVSITLLPS